MPRIHAALALAFLWTIPPASAQPSAAAPKAAPTQAAAPAQLTPEQARRALDTLQDERKRAQMIDTLRAIAGAAPAAHPAQAAETPDQPAATPATPAADQKPALSADSLGAQLLLTISEQLTETSKQIAAAARAVTHFPAFYYWFLRTANDPSSYHTLLDIAWKLGLVFGCALVAEWLVWWASRKPLALLEARVPRSARVPAAALDMADPPSSAADVTPARELHRRWLRLARLWQALLRLPFVLGRLALELLPVLVFAGVSTLLLSTAIGDDTQTRLVLLAIINAYVLSRALICLVRAVVSPFGLVHVGEETGAYVEIWARRIVAVGVGGFALANVALLLGLHRSGYWALLRLVVLAVHLLVVVIILQCRAQIARAIRPAHGSEGFVAAARTRVAGLWHYIAIALVLALWVVWALNIRNGYALLLQYFVGTVAVLLLGRLATMLLHSLIDRGFRINADVLQRFPGLEARANRYLPMLRQAATAVVAVVAAVALLQVWGVDAIVWFYGGQIGSRLVSAVITVGIAAVVAIAVWEASNALMDRQLATLTRNGHVARAARLRTFQPMLRTALLCVIVTIVALTALSEVGVNVAPLLAGAGIVGIAIGFGSQKLVQDLITGLFLLIENVVQVGDTVTVSGLSGVVENVSIRTLRLRAGDGSVHVIPFSAVTTITNASRGAGNASVSVNVAYNEDTDRAGEILRAIVTEMRREDGYRGLIRGDLELWGVDKVDGAMASIVGQIRCTDAGRWPVQREFNRRMKLRFQEHGIEIASPAHTVFLQIPPLQAEDTAPERKRVAG